MKHILNKQLLTQLKKFDIYPITSDKLAWNIDTFNQCVVTIRKGDTLEKIIHIFFYEMYEKGRRRGKTEKANEFRKLLEID